MAGMKNLKIGKLTFTCTGWMTTVADGHVIVNVQDEYIDYKLLLYLAVESGGEGGGEVQISLPCDPEAKKTFDFMGRVTHAAGGLIVIERETSNDSLGKFSGIQAEAMFNDNTCQVEAVYADLNGVNQEGGWIKTRFRTRYKR